MDCSKWLMSALGLLATGAVPAAELTISCGTPPTEAFLCEQPAMEWARATGNTVRIAPAPQQTNDRYEAYQAVFAAQSAELDVVEIDLIWPAALSEHLVDLVSVEQIDAKSGGLEEYGLARKLVRADPFGRSPRSHFEQPRHLTAAT